VSTNYLGVEIHIPLAERANEITVDNGNSAKNLHYVGCNANVSLRTMNLPNFQRASILFADPHQHKHKNRRIVTVAFAELITELIAGTCVGARSGENRSGS